MMKLGRVRLPLTIAAVALSGIAVYWFSRAERVGVVPPPEELTRTIPQLLSRTEGMPMELPPEVRGTRELLVVFFVDGLYERSFSGLLEAGRLPAVSRLLEERPSWRGVARGTFPSSTAPAIPEALAGRWSHRLGGMPDNIHALDRREGRLIRYEVASRRWDGGAMTLFDHLVGEGGVTLTYFEGFYPGANITVHDELLYLLDIAMVKGRKDAVLAYDDRMVADLERRLGAARLAPNLLFVRLGAVDIAGHFYGPSSDPYAQAILAVDRSIGKIMATLEANEMTDGRSLLDAAHFVLFSDHGIEQTETRVDLDAVLRAAGLDPFPTSDPGALVASVLDPDGIKEHDAVVVPNGSNIATIYLRRKGPRAPLPWIKVPLPGAARRTRGARGTVDLVEHLLATDGVLRVYELTAKDEVTVHGASGRLRVSRIRMPDGRWQLAAFLDGDDPFGDCEAAASPCCHADEPNPALCYLGLDDWRDRTAAWDRPELPLMIMKAFSGPKLRRPDLLVEADDHCGFIAETRGDHGRYVRDLLRVPLLLAGNRIDEGAKIDDARLVDLVPTLLPLFGFPPAALDDLDGRNLELLLPAWNGAKP